MAKASGYAALLTKERATTFLTCVEEDQRFGEPVPDFQHSRNAPLVCFVAIRLTLETGKAMAIAIKSKKAGAKNV